MDVRLVFAAMLLLSAVAPRTVSACVAGIEEHSNSPSASFRVQPFGQCQTTEEHYRQVVKAWLAQRPAGAPPVTSLALGRALGFPWISQHLADSALASPQWRRIVREPGSAHNAFVSATLSEPVFLGRLAVPFEGSPFVVFKVSVEKVLIGPASKYSSTNPASQAIVPFDAQIWLRLAPR